MKSMLFSALVIFALATTGCAVQTGSSGCSDGLCGNQAVSDCMPLSGDCGCGAPKGLTPSCSLVRKLGDNRGMGLRVNQKGTACNQNRGNGLFSRMKTQQVAPAALMGGDCGCGAGDSVVSMDGGNCGCDAGTSVVSMSDGNCGCNAGDSVVSVGGGCGCDAGDAVVSISEGDCGCEDAGSGGLLGKACGCGLKGKLGGCCLKDKLGSCCLFGGKGKVAAAPIAAGSGCGVKGCGVGGGICGGCLSKLRGANGHPYGGAIPHTAQAPGNGTGMAPAYAYPYYTTRGPRDFLMKNPPSIGY